ncbi:MAG: 4-oxalocrotonate tautomerase family protein [Firmicutes bacterium]|nr:4-oxalocrotonate tautomerase family protein [Bacillota bacterium]
MPIVTVQMWQGRTREVKCELISGISEVVCRVLKVPRSAVCVILQEIPRENWGENGRPADAQSESPPAT